MLLFFSSPIGLGHAARDAAIAAHRTTDTRFVSGGAAAGLLQRSGFRADDRYAPPPLDVRDGRLVKPAGWLWRYYRYYKECKRAALDIIRTGSPQAVASDEDFASLAAAQEQGIPTVLVTDILETRFTRGIGSILERGMNRSMRRIVSRCDAVIMPEHGPDTGNIRRVGPIVRETRSTRDELRNRLGFEGRTILVTAGGTAAGLFLIEGALQAVRKAGAGRYDAVVAAGPSLDRTFENARNLGFVRNLHEVIYAADLVISLAGRSTIDEANAYGTPGIFIPVKDHFEQEDNARREGFSHKDLGRLEELIAERIGGPRREARPGGARMASRIIEGVAETR